MTSLRSFALYTLRALGGFALAQWLTRKRLRILCYHGFSLGDEHGVYPVLFMRGSVFENRMKVLNKRNVPVVSLEEGVKKLQAGEISRAETVITLDDGWVSNLTIGLPILERYKFPACIYATTEHLDAGTEVFNVVLGYMLMRTSKKAFTLKGIHPNIDGEYTIPENPMDTSKILVKATEETFSLPEKQQHLKAIAQALGFDLDELLSGDRFRLATRDEILKLSESGIDIELHSHTHRLPADDFESMSREIVQNREALQKVIGKEASHFCYPSGAWAPQHPAWLARLGVASATTCDPGFNSRTTPPLLLKRYLDRDDASDIEFEAEISGIRELARIFRERLQPRRAAKQTDAHH